MSVGLPDAGANGGASKHPCTAKYQKEWSARRRLGCWCSCKRRCKCMGGGGCITRASRSSHHRGGIVPLEQRGTLRPRFRRGDGGHASMGDGFPCWVPAKLAARADVLWVLLWAVASPGCATAKLWEAGRMAAFRSVCWASRACSVAGWFHACSAGGLDQLGAAQATRREPPWKSCCCWPRALAGGVKAQALQDRQCLTLAIPRCRKMNLPARGLLAS